MKKTLIALSSAALMAVVLFTGCSKDEDTTAPVITLVGANPLTINLQSTYVDPGATATDNEDGTISSGQIIVDASDVNEDKEGTYTVSYSVTDAAGNSGTATRTVIVQNALVSSPWQGSYSCVITTVGQPPYSYNDGCIISTTLNNGLAWNKFGDYSNATGKLSFRIDGSGNVTLPTQSFTCGTVPVLRQFSGSGNSTGSGATGSTITMQITETVNSIATAFTYTFTKM